MGKSSIKSQLPHDRSTEGHRNLATTPEYYGILRVLRSYVSRAPGESSFKENFGPANMLRRVSVACIIWHFALPIQVGSCLCIPPVLPLTCWNPSDARGWTSDAVANVRSRRIKPAPTSPTRSMGLTCSRPPKRALHTSSVVGLPHRILSCVPLLCTWVQVSGAVRRETAAGPLIQRPICYRERWYGAPRFGRATARRIRCTFLQPSRCRTSQRKAARWLRNRVCG